MVSGKGSTRGVGSVLARRKANNQKTGIRVPERRYRATKIIRKLGTCCIKEAGEPFT